MPKKRERASLSRELRCRRRFIPSGPGSFLGPHFTGVAAVRGARWFYTSCYTSSGGRELSEYEPRERIIIGAGYLDARDRFSLSSGETCAARKFERRGNESDSAFFRDWLEGVFRVVLVCWLLWWF